MNITYIISIILFYILFTLIRKRNEKKDFIPTLIINFLCVLAYQMIICWTFSVFSIPISLINLNIANIIAIILEGIVIKLRGIQKYSLCISDLLATTAIIIIVSIISYIDVGKLDKIRYFSTDASIHYIAAKEFYENDKMLYKTENTETYHQMMPIAYVNVGILFKAFEPIIGYMSLYKIFLLFDITIFSFSGIIFYFIIKEKVNSKLNGVFSIAITTVYLLGYPLNNLLNGFYYLGIGCLTVNSIIYFISCSKQLKDIDILEEFFLNFCLIFSYTLFAIPVYLATFIYKTYIVFKKSKTLFNKNYIINIAITQIIPGILAIIYLVMPNVTAVKALAIEGYIYKNMMINIIIFIPFIIYYIYTRIKEKKIDFKLIYFMTLAIFIIILYLTTKIKIISEYYFYKNAYIFWTIILAYMFMGIVEFIGRHPNLKSIPIGYIFVYLSIIVIMGFSRKTSVKSF